MVELDMFESRRDPQEAAYLAPSNKARHGLSP